MEIVNKETQRYSCCKEKTHQIHSALFQTHIPHMQIKYNGK